VSSAEHYMSEACLLNALHFLALPMGFTHCN
jgi:hypothetical protein